MAVILTILKWLGIILLVLLAVVLVVLILALLVPLRYNVSANVPDPEAHESPSPGDPIRDANVNAYLTWFLKLLVVTFSYPGDKMLGVRVLGKELDVDKLLHRGKQQEEQQPEEEEKEEKEPKSLEDRIDEIIEKTDRIFLRADYYHRLLTGSCGRRAVRKVMARLLNILESMLPSEWYVRGKIGLGDPYRSGKIAQTCAVLYPVTEEHLQLDTEWTDYQYDISADIKGGFRLGKMVTQLVPVLFDKDCRKLYKKYKAVKKRLSVNGG